MKNTDTSKMGKKGEILPKRVLREIANIKPGDKIMIEASPGELRIRKILTVDEIFELEKISRDVPEDMDKQIEEEIKLQMEKSDDEHSA